jgi:hypothetical protein
MRGNRLSVDETKKEAQRAATFGKGGSTKMFKQQAAGTDRPGNTGKDQTAAPGAKFAKGGSKKFSYSSSLLAKASPAAARAAPWSQMYARLIGDRHASHARRRGVKMQYRRRIMGYATAEEIAADCLFETQGNVAEAQRLARRRIVDEDDYQHVANLIEAAAERISIPADK